MQTSELVEYFSAEKHAALLLLALAAIGVALGVYLRAVASPFKAMAWALFVFAAIQASVGVGLLMRTDSQIAALQRGFDATPAATAAAERERMRKVNRAWRPIKIVEIALIAVGILLIAVGESRGLNWTACGIALVIEAGVMLAFDIFAERRAMTYTEWIGLFCSNPNDSEA
jgi:hypothetical protein